jgi:drug/metabolite transporter (DMT)-like permease
VQQDRDQMVGLGFALLSGIFLGSAVAVSRFAYDGGASGIVVAIFRSCVMIAVLVVGIKLAGRRLGLPREMLPLSIVNGILMGAMAYGNIGAVEFIPVGLASLLFFTFPVVIAVLVMVLRIEHVTLPKLFAIVLAFVGLGIMLGVSIGNVDGRGTALSLMGSLATAVNAILVGRYFRQANVFVITLHFSVVALIFLVILALSAAEVRLPVTSGGWGGLLGVALLQAIGSPLYFYAIAKVGALKTGMAINIQPVTSIVEAWVLFGEVLGALQALGGALVLFAIGIMQWVDLRNRRRELRVEGKSSE